MTTPEDERERLRRELVWLATDEGVDELMARLEKLTTEELEALVFALRRRWLERPGPVTRDA